jgi:hypothetical protein
MKTKHLLPLVAFPFLGSSCFTTTQVQVIEHRKEPQGHYSVLFKILTPDEVAGKYYNGSTWRGDLVKDADGGIYQIGFNYSMYARVASDPSLKRMPREYSDGPPVSKETDFLEMAKRLR